MTSRRSDTLEKLAGGMLLSVRVCLFWGLNAGYIYRELTTMLIFAPGTARISTPLFCANHAFTRRDTTDVKLCAAAVGKGE